MQNRKIAVVLFCVVSTTMMSSCVKKTVEKAGTPIMAVARVTRGIFGRKCGTPEHVTHTHTKKFCEVPPIEEASKGK